MMGSLSSCSFTTSSVTLWTTSRQAAVKRVSFYVPFVDVAPAAQKVAPCIDSLPIARPLGWQRGPRESEEQRHQEFG